MIWRSDIVGAISTEKGNYDSNRKVHTKVLYYNYQIKSIFIKLNRSKAAVRPITAG